MVSVKRSKPPKPPKPPKKKVQHEIENEIDRIVKDLGGDLSIHYLVPLLVRGINGRDALVPSHLHSDAHPRALDSVRWGAICGFRYPGIFIETRQKLSTAWKLVGELKSTYGLTDHELVKCE